MVVDALAAHLAAYPASGEGYVFTDQRGRPLTGNGFNKAVWGPATERAGLASTGMYALRHYFASVLIDVGLSGCAPDAPREVIFPRSSGPNRYLALKYAASGWWAMIASVDCSGSSWNSSDKLTPIRPASSRSTTLARSSRSGHAG